MVAAVGSPIHSVQIVHLDHDSDDPNLLCAVTNDGRVALAPFLAENDIVVNCVLQDTDAPLTFLTEQDLGAFLPGSLIVDVSCDEGMGFSWARPTSFTAPSFVVGDNVHYYAVDHSPSYLWNSATWEISEALLPHLRTVLAGRAAWEADPTIGRAIEIRDGEILNPNSVLPTSRRRVSARGRVERDPAPARLEPAKPSFDLSLVCWGRVDGVTRRDLLCG